MSPEIRKSQSKNIKLKKKIEQKHILQNLSEF